MGARGVPQTLAFKKKMRTADPLIQSPRVRVRWYARHFRTGQGSQLGGGRAHPLHQIPAHALAWA